MIIEKPKPFKFNYINFGFPEANWERKAYWNLRKDVFCTEQQVFSHHDIDDIDKEAIPIAAFDECCGIVHNVVGAVRIDERSPGVWWGSRLCVHKDYRTHARFKTHGLFQDPTHVNNVFTLSIGGALIYKAVSTANYLGCDRFYAHVQAQNVKFFKRLYWNPIEEIELHGRPHFLMEADLDRYPASRFIETIKKAS